MFFGNFQGEATGLSQKLNYFWNQHPQKWGESNLLIILL